MSRQPKDLVALIVDCGPNMREKSISGQTYMDLVKLCLRKIIEQKIFSQSKFEYILIGLGINAENSEYPFVARLSDLGVANLKLLKTIASLEPTDNVGKLIDALSFASELLHTLPNPKTKYEHKKIGLFTNFSFTLDGPETIIYSVHIGKPRELYLNVVCRYTFDELSKSFNNLFPTHHAFLQLLINLDKLASVYTFDYAISSLPYLEPSEQNAAPWYTKIFVGYDLIFPVTGYVKTTEHKKRTWSKAYIEPSTKDSQNDSFEDKELELPQKTIPLDRNVSYKTHDESGLELDKEEVARAYLFGKTIVPVTPEDEEAMKFKSHLPPAVRILFWTSRNNVKQFYYTGSRSMLFIPDIKAKDFAPSVAFNILAQAMLDSNRVAIVSMMRTARCNPQIGSLTPCYMGESLVLIYNQLPFAEDIRTYKFPPLVDELNRPQDIPSSNELDLIDDLIKMMSLVAEDEHGNFIEYLACETLHDPFDRIQFQAIVHRYMKPDAPLPKELLEDQTLSTPPHILKRCEGVFHNIRDKFKLIETLKRFSTQQNENNIESPMKKPKSENEKDTLTELSLNKAPVDTEGTGAVKKSSQELDSEVIVTLTKFTEQLNELAKDLLGFNDGKIIKIIEEFRKTCIEFNAPYVFNPFMMSYKQKISQKSVWKLIVKKQITLISSEESNATEIPPETAIAFLQCQ